MAKFDLNDGLEKLNMMNISVVDAMVLGDYKGASVSPRLVVGDRRLEEALGYITELAPCLAVYEAYGYAKENMFSIDDMEVLDFRTNIRDTIKNTAKVMRAFFVPERASVEIPATLEGRKCRVRLRHLLKESIECLSNVVYRRKGGWEDIFLSPVLDFLVEVAYRTSDLGEFAPRKMKYDFKSLKVVKEWLDSFPVALPKGFLKAEPVERVLLTDKTLGFLRRSLPDVTTLAKVNVRKDSIFRTSEGIFFTTKGLCSGKNLAVNLLTATPISIRKGRK